jgi:creatinine amidohydrolase/Fe(II)-dependent formamide hydrolase-like protein
VAARLNRDWAGEATRVFAPAEYYEASSQGFDRVLRARGFGEAEIGTHAGLADTSLQMALAPGTVRSEVLRSGTRLDETVGIHGGDPRRASAELGALGVEQIVTQTVAAIRRDIRDVRRGSGRPAATTAGTDGTPAGSGSRAAD